MSIFWAVFTYVFWGFTPIFWKQFPGLSSLELLAQRTFWSFVFLLPIFLCRAKRAEVRELLTSRPRTVGALLLSALLIGANWYFYVHAMLSGQVLEASLGYFMTPLMSIFLGVVILKERLNRYQWIAVGLGFIAAVFQGAKTGQVPHLALLLSSTFALFAYLKKRLHLSANVALALEVGVIGLPLLVYYGMRGIPPHDGRTWALLVLTGPITVYPLMWYTWALKKIPLTAAAFLHYLSPIIQFGLAIAVFREPLHLDRMLTFLITWLALAVFTWDVWRGVRARQKASRRRLSATARPAPALEEKIGVSHVG